MKIYLAAMWQRKNEIREFAEELKAHGFTVTSRWLYEQHMDDEAYSREVLGALAENDVEDVRACDVLVSFTEGTHARGGRHVEFGIGVALGKVLLVLGPDEHIFHRLPEVQMISSKKRLVQALFALKGSHSNS